MDEGEDAAAALAAEEPPPPSQLSGDSGNVSQSHSSTSGLGDEEAAAEGELLPAATADYAAYLLQPLDGASSAGQIRTLDKSLEDLLTRVDEFVGMLDMAFVKMVGNNVAGMEEHITKAEADLGTFPSTFKKLLHTINVPSFLNKPSSLRPKQSLYEPPDLFKTEDYFPSMSET
ncbi:PREDICTED: biogenesis of lysosome-related organelles complex 1 subunit 4 isoform X2 [Gekko japonicus]|uniref:Biogenesis of lysosome-related organelles complex 1 subunit 4 isoform X2 n=1 Tax=Gekko japonicus TaxID=146911 RepID=A0ABM1K2M8_GEKJA|nr:PREDICTED: biogenesis of lysosome-related organelles complex 1 subunit 4 isoform X2 [Gekko japonicus]